jgi:hypothetical protein
MRSVEEASVMLASLFLRGKSIVEDAVDVAQTRRCGCPNADPAAALCGDHENDSLLMRAEQPAPARSASLPAGKYKVLYSDRSLSDRNITPSDQFAKVSRPSLGQWQS